MTSRQRILLALIACALVPAWAGCDDSFSPKQDYRERIVVFAVLDASAPFQVVRLERTYDAEGTDPSKPKDKNPVTAAIVSIYTSRKVFPCKDTVLDTGSGRKTVWITRELVPEEGQSYTLQVDLPSGEHVAAELTVPNKSYVQIFSANPSIGRYGVEVGAGGISASFPAKGFLFRLWVAGDIFVDGKKTEIRREVPVSIDLDGGAPVYPTPSRETSTLFSVNEIARIGIALEQQEKAIDLRLIGRAYAMDVYLYNYFQTVRGFDDPVSVRQDKPDVTNIRGGLGVFGALVPDSVKVSYTSILTGQ